MKGDSLTRLETEVLCPYNEEALSLPRWETPQAAFSAKLSPLYQHSPADSPCSIPAPTLTSLVKLPANVSITAQGDGSWQKQLPARIWTARNADYVCKSC